MGLKTPLLSRLSTTGALVYANFSDPPFKLLTFQTLETGWIQIQTQTQIQIQTNCSISKPFTESNFFTVSHLYRVGAILTCNE